MWKWSICTTEMYNVLNNWFTCKYLCFAEPSLLVPRHTWSSLMLHWAWLAPRLESWGFLDRLLRADLGLSIASGVTEFDEVRWIELNATFNDIPSFWMLLSSASLGNRNSLTSFIHNLFYHILVPLSGR